MNPTIRKPAQGRTVAVVGDVYRFLATGDETNGKYAMWEAVVPPGGGPPPHVPSREEEGFYILEGEITFTVNGEQIMAKAGTFANMPVGTPHSFKNESSRRAKMLISAAPAGLEQMFFEVGVPLAEGASTALPATKEEIDRMLVVAPRYGIEFGCRGIDGDVMTRFLRTGKKTRPKNSLKGRRYRSATCRKRSPKPVKTPAPWYCPKFLDPGSTNETGVNTP